MFIPAFLSRRFVRSMFALAGWSSASSLAPAAEEVRVELTTWIGRAHLGSEDGAAARLSGPSGIALDASGNLFIADTGNATVRLRTPSGTVTTFAGLAGTMGMLDGTGAAARFSAPQHLATDGAGNLYALDVLSLSVRKITPAGVVTTLRVAELCPTLNAPSGIAVSSDGQTLYLSDRGNHVVRRLAVASSTLTVLAGDERFAGSADGTGTAARFYDPSGLALDGAGNLYVADARNHTIRRITPAGVVTTLAGTAGESGTTDGTGAAARFYMPKALALDGAGNLYIADAGNHTVRRLVLATGAVSTWAGVAARAGSADGTGAVALFDFPAALAAQADGTLYVADARNSTIRRIASDRTVTTIVGTAPGDLDATTTGARLRRPQSVAVDASGNAYIADTGNHTIRRVTPTGVVTTLAGSAGMSGSADGTGADARFNRPAGILVDGAGTLYVADAGNHTIRRITAAGEVTTLAGAAGQAGSLDGAGTATRFREPHGLAFDRAGNLIVADTLNNMIRRVTPAGVVTTVAGNATFYGVGSTDGTGTAVQFEHPLAVAVDASGVIFVADSGNATLRRIDAAGTVSTFAGQVGSHGTTDGTGTVARFERPSGLAFDSVGNLYVADSDASTLRRVSATGEVLTVAGTAQQSGSADGAGPTALLASPHGLAFGPGDQLYVADTANHAIRRGPAATGTTPVITQQPSGFIYWVGRANQKIPSFTVVATATPATLHYRWQRRPKWGEWTDLTDDGVFAGTRTDTLTMPGVTTAYHDNTIRCLVDNGFNTVTATADDVYLWVIPSTSDVHFVNSPEQAEFVCNVTTVAGTAPADSSWGGTWASTDGVGAAARFASPHGIACDATGSAYIVDASAGTLRCLDADGTVTTLAGDGTWGSTDGLGKAARFAGPQAVAVGSDGNIYVADTENGRVRRVTPAGVVSTLADSAGTPLAFKRPQGIAADTLGNLYVSDTDDYTVRCIAPDGTVTRLAGLSGQSGSRDGAASVATLGSPGALAVDAAGVVYLLDRGTQTVRTIARDGTVATLAGAVGETGLEDGVGTAARFSFPSGIAVDARGVVYVTDSTTHLVRRITPDGRVLTIAGRKPAYTGMLCSGSADGAGLSATFYGPCGIACDPAGNLLLTDLGNGTVRRLTLRPVQIGEVRAFTMLQPAGDPGNYRWQMLAPGSTTWVDMADGGYFSGTGTKTLSVTGAAELNGYQFRCYTWRGYDDADATSGTTTLVVGIAPTITRQPADTAVARGGSAAFTVAATGEPAAFAYRWQRQAEGSAAWTDLADGGAYRGTGTATLTVSPVTTALHGERYRCVVDNYIATAATSASAVLSVSGLQSQFAALSARAPAGAGEQTLILGFVFAGGGKPTLVRGVGPGLSEYVDGYLRNPRLALQQLSGDAWIGAGDNDDWGGASELATAFARTGAGALAAGSADAALLSTLTGTVYTAQVSGVGGTTGVALAEVYDAALADKTRRLTALSVRNQVGTGEAILIAGFVIVGDAPKRVIVRGVGPGLTGAVASYLANPYLQLWRYESKTWTLVGENDDWDGSADTAALFDSASMGKLTVGSKDAVLVLTLAPGVYTAQVSGVGATTGVGLVEIYEAP